MIRSSMFPGRYVQGVQAMRTLGEELTRFGDSAYIICDPFVLENLLPSFRESLEKNLTHSLEEFGGECSREEIERLQQGAVESEFEVIVGIGGGKTLDTAKALGHEIDRPVAIVPTTASTDAPCSALSVIYTAGGEFEEYLFLPENPNLVLVDTTICAQAPVRFLVSGMGDALATWFEAQSCRDSYSNHVHGTYGTMSAFHLAQLCYQTLLEYGSTARTACENDLVIPAVDHVVEANTLLSGLGFESGGLAAAHAIHNGLTQLEPTHDYLHGEKVAIGTLASLFLTDKSQEVIGEVFSFCEAVGLPSSLSEIGLGDVSDDDLQRVAEGACAEDETIHNEPMTVTPEMVSSALRSVEAESVKRKENR